MSEQSPHHTPEIPKTREIAGPKAVYVWDLPTRLFHWALVAAVATSLISVELGNMSIHLISGHVVLALLIFRLVWGLVGGRHARFASFVQGPIKVINYARGVISGNAPAHPGHNPMGGWSVIAMVLVLAVQAVSGLFANDDILTEGPLASTITKSTSDFLTYIHHLTSNAVYALVVLHLAAVTFYTVKGHRIIMAMITGKSTDVTVDQTESGEDSAHGSLILGLVIFAVAGGIAYAIMNY